MKAITTTNLLVVSELAKLLFSKIQYSVILVINTTLILIVLSYIICLHFLTHIIHSLFLSLHSGLQIYSSCNLNCIL